MTFSKDPAHTGNGTMLGTLTDMRLRGVVQNLLMLTPAPSFWIRAIYGAIIPRSLMVTRLTGGDA